MPRFSFVPTMNANNNCTHPRRLTRTHVRVPSAVVLCAVRAARGTCRVPRHTSSVRWLAYTIDKSDSDVLLEIRRFKREGPDLSVLWTRPKILD